MREAIRYFLDQEAYWRKAGDAAYADAMLARAAWWREQ